MESGPELNVKGNAVVSVLGNTDNFVVVETAAEVRAKMSELREQGSFSLGEEEGDRSGMLLLLGLDIYADPALTVPRIEPYDLSLHPGTVAVVREITETYWKGHMQNVMGLAEQRRGGSPAAEGMPPGVKDMLEGMGFQIMDWGGRGEPIGHGAKPALAAEVNPHQECCCQHNASDHEADGQFVGACKKCGCGLFHTHS